MTTTTIILIAAGLLIAVYAGFTAGRMVERYERLRERVEQLEEAQPAKGGFSGNFKQLKHLEDAMALLVHEQVERAITDEYLQNIKYHLGRVRGLDGDE